MTSLGATNSACKRTDEKNSSPISTPGQWCPEGSGEIIEKLKNLLQLRSQNDIELHVKEV